MHEIPWGNPPAHLVFPLSIYQLAAAYKVLNSSLLPTWCSFVGSPFHGAAPISNISYSSFWVQLFGKGAFFFKLCMNKIWDSCILDPREDNYSDYKKIFWLIFAMFGSLNKCYSKWKCSHISLQIQDFSISSYAIDGKSQSILFSPEESVADKALCHSVTCSPDFSHSMMAALRLPWLFVSVWKSCPNLEEKGCSMQRETTDSNICENEAVFDSVHMHILFFILISRVFLTY